VRRLVVYVDDGPMIEIKAPNRNRTLAVLPHVGEVHRRAGVALPPWQFLKLFLGQFLAHKTTPVPSER